MRRIGFPFFLRGFGTGLFGTVLMGGLGYLLGRNSQRQYQNYQGIPTTGTGFDANERMRTLNDLHDRGVLTDAEYETEKSRILYS